MKQGLTLACQMQVTRLTVVSYIALTGSHPSYSLNVLASRSLVSGYRHVAGSANQTMLKLNKRPFSASQSDVHSWYTSMSTHDAFLFLSQSGHHQGDSAASAFSRGLLGESRPRLDVVNDGHLTGVLLILFAPALATVAAGRPRVGMVHAAGGFGLCMSADVDFFCTCQDALRASGILGGEDGPGPGCMGTGTAVDEVLGVMMPLDCWLARADESLDLSRGVGVAVDVLRCG